jgi:hypothetical protein
MDYALLYTKLIVGYWILNVVLALLIIFLTNVYEDINDEGRKALTFAGIILLFIFPVGAVVGAVLAFILIRLYKIFDKVYDRYINGKADDRLASKFAKPYTTPGKYEALLDEKDRSDGHTWNR